VASTLARLAMSPAARSLWQAYRSSRRPAAFTNEHSAA